MLPMRRRIASAIAIVLWLAGCNATFDFVAPPGEDQLYGSLYPYYAEFCAVSQIRKKPGFGADTSGGPGGHSVLYLNGVCRDRGAGYPTIALCADGNSVASQGVGLSVNAHFKNANWVATDGPNFFFDGDLARDEKLTRAAYDRTQAKAEQMGLLDGIVFHPEVFDDMPPGADRRDYMYEVSVATDYAIAFGRDRYCARVPVTRDQMAKIVTYLNGVNAIYKDGSKDFVWNVLQNNCTHLAHNALAAAGLWNDWETDQFFLFAAFDFPVPKNEFVNAMRRANDMDLTDLRAVYRDRAARNSLIENDRLPAEPGVLAEAVPVTQDNDIYDTKLKLIFYDQPLLGPYQRRFRAIFAEPRYTDIEANLRYFSVLYQKIGAERQPLAHYLTAQSPERREDFAVFYARFYDHIDREAAKVTAQLDALSSVPSVARYRQ
jgi:hypothetical protein